MRTATGTTGGVSYTIIYPEMMTFIYSDHAFVDVTISDTNKNPLAGERLQLVAIVGNKQNVNNYRYTDGNGRAVFDIARLLQLMTEDREQEMRQPYADHLWQQKQAAIDLYIYGTRIARLFIETANGRHFITEGWNTTPQHLKWWKSLPFTFDIPNTDRLILQYKGAAIETQVKVTQFSTSLLSAMTRRVAADIVKQDRPSIRIRIPDDVAGISVRDGIMTSTNNSVVLEIDDCTSMENRTYLRWLGQHGEIYYWLFFDKSETLSVKSEQFSKAVTSDDYRRVGDVRYLDDGRVLDIETSRSKTIYSEPVDERYYRMLLEIVDSPCVDMYLGDNKWQRVRISDGSYSKDLKGRERQKRHRMTITISIGE